MKAAIVTQPNHPPIYSDFETPAPEPGENSVAVTAAALSQLVKRRASGTNSETVAHTNRLGNDPELPVSKGVMWLHFHDTYSLGACGQ